MRLITWLRSNFTDIIFVALALGAFLYLAQFLFLSAGPITAGWGTDFEKSNVSLDEIFSGGVPRDGIPPIDNPTFASIEDSRWLQSQSPVIALEVNGDARAYPLGILTRHEIVNDVVGGIPVAVTFCPLCNSAIVYDRRVDGEVLRFGVSGNLRNSDLVMWDDRTESWWQQLTGEGIVGEYTGRWLDFVPSQVVGFGAFVEQYPDGQVLATNTGSSRNPYVGYDSNPDPFLFAGTPDSRLFPTARVFATVLDNTPIAYDFHTLSQRNVINDMLNAADVVVFWEAGATSALDGSNIDTSKDVGMAGMFHREVDGQTLTFQYEDGEFRDLETDSTWNIFGVATEGELEGTQLEIVHAFPHFWFAWAAFHPDTELYES